VSKPAIGKAWRQKLGCILRGTVSMSDVVLLTAFFVIGGLAGFGIRSRISTLRRRSAQIRHNRFGPLDRH